MKKQKFSETISMAVIFGILLAVFLCIALSFFTKNVIVDIIGINIEPFSTVLLKNIEQESVEENTSEGDATKAAGTDNTESDIKPDYAKLYPYKNGASPYSDAIKNKTVISKYSDFINKIESMIDPYSNKFLFFEEACVTVNNAIEELIGWKLTTDEVNGVIFMNNGFLAGTSELLTDEEIDQLADSAEDFNEYLKSKGIPFIYANIGSNVCPYDRQMYDTSHEHSNENSDNLVNALRKRNIDTIDFREEMIKDNIDWYSGKYYYRTDHHWTTYASLWASGIIAEKLNDDYGFHFNKELFSPDSYTITHFNDYWLGSRGRTVTLSRTTLDDYDLILPDFATDLTVDNAERNIHISGSYDSSVMDLKSLYEIADYDEYDHLNKISAYECTTTTIAPLVSIHNNLKTGNDGKKLLILRDSYSNYLMSYLACDIDDVVALRKFPGSVRTFIEEYEPDAVLMIHRINSIFPLETDPDHYFNLQ